MPRYLVVLPFDDAKEIDAENARSAADKFMESWPHETSIGSEVIVVAKGEWQRFVLGMVERA